MTDQILLETHVQLEKPDDYPMSLGKYRFAVLPRVGETIHVKEGDEEHDLTVIAVDHYGYGEGESPWGGVISLTCKRAN